MKNASLKRILKYLLVGTGCFIVLAFVSFKLYMSYTKYFQDDIPPPDDSQLMITRDYISEDLNGYNVLMEATWPLFESPIDPDFRNSSETVNDDELDKMIEICRERLSIIERAVQYRDFQEPIPKCCDEDKPNYPAIGDLSRLRIAIARRDMRQGNSEAAVNNILVVLKTGQAMEISSTSLICYAFGLAIKNMALSAIYDIVVTYDPDISLINDIVSNIADSHESNDGFRNALKGEYLLSKYVFQKTEAYRNKELKKRETLKFAEKLQYISNPKGHAFFRVNHTYKNWIDTMLPVIESVGKPYKDMKLENVTPTSKGMNWKAVNWLRATATGNFIGEILLEVGKPNLKRLFDKSFYTEFMISSLETMIALKSYRNRNGTLPESLSELVPEYIDSIPHDPFDGKPIRYDPDKKIIYSVGTDSIDDGGTADKHLYSSVSFKDLEKEKDFVIDLSKL
ncbi:MAG TPA: hypothetical protein PLN69_08855 [bacterium]|nr:hypothetical protein [bacterium]